MKAGKNSEQELAKLFRSACQGSGTDYRRFLQHITPILRGVIQAKAGGIRNEDKEDILQDVLMAIHFKRQSWRPDHPVKPWLYAITRYKIVDYYRRQGRAQHVDIDFIQEEAIAETPEPTQGMDIEVMVGMLSEKQQAIVRSISIEGQSIGETAKRFNMKETAVRVNFHRALKKLRDQAQKMDEV